MTRRTLTVALAVLAPSLIPSCGRTSSADPENVIPAQSAIGRRTDIPNLRAVKGSDLGHLARAWRGKGTLFNIWATWCGSCKGEMPIMSQVAKTYASRGLNVVLVSVDSLSSLALVAAGMIGVSRTM